MKKHRYTKLALGLLWILLRFLTLTQIGPIEVHFISTLYRNIICKTRSKHVQSFFIIWL